MYYLIVVYVNAVTSVKAFDSFRSADRYLNALLRDKFCEIAKYDIMFCKDTLEISKLLAVGY